jgi:prevent-host-death family protein
MRTQAKGRVLIVEDPAHRIGAPAGFDTKSVAKVPDAIELARKEPFDLFIVDADLPLVSGASFLQELSEVQRSPYVIFFSSHPSNELAVTAAELHMRSHIFYKPVEPKVVLRACSAAMESQDDFSELLRAVVRPSKAQSVSATSAKNEFGAVLESAVQDGAVLITKHETPKAVLVSVDRVNELLARREPNLDALTAEFDQLVARMRTPEGKKAARALFDAPPSAFGDAAVAGAKKRA